MELTASSRYGAGVFADAFLPNLVIFAIGQLAAWANMHTGRPVRGLILMLGVFFLADLALLCRFVLPDAEAWYLPVLIAMQTWALVEAGLFLYGRWRRRSQALAEQRVELYRAAMRHYLRNELEPAQKIWRRLRWRDPWDVEATLALATSFLRAGETKRGRGYLRKARALDVDGRFADSIHEEFERTLSA